MGALTDAQKRFVEDYQPSTGFENPPEEFYSAPFKYNPVDTDLGTMNMLRMIGNTPYSALKTAEAFYEAGKDPLEVGKVLIEASQGAADIALSPLGVGAPDSERAQLARELGTFFADRVMNPGRTIVEDPVGGLLDLSAFGGALPKATKAGALAQGMNPARMGAESLQGIRGVTQKAGNWAAEQLASMPTGFDPGHFRQMRKSAREGRRGESIGALREQIGSQNVLKSFDDAIDNLVEVKRTEYQSQLPNIKMKADAEPLSLGQVRNNLLDELEDTWRIELTPDETGKPILDAEAFGDSKIASTAQQRRVKRLVDELYKWNDDSIEGMDILKQRIWEITESSPRFSKSNAIVKEVFGDIRKQLGDKVEGYDKLTGDFESISKSQILFKRVLGAGNENPEVTLSKLTGVMKDSPTSELRKQILNELERLGGKSIIDQVAGLDLSQWSPKGIVGKSAAWGLVSGVGVGAAVVDPALLGALAFLPLTSPRVMGEFFSALGAKQRIVDKVEKFVGGIYSKLPSNAMVDGLTIGAAIKKAQMSGIREPLETPSVAASPSISMVK